MLTLLTGALGIFGGAKRWLNGEMVKALMVAVASIAILAGGAMIFKSGKTSGGIRERFACLAGIQKANAINQQRVELRRAASESAAALARDDALNALRAEAEKSANLERELAALKDNPVAFPRILVRSLNK